MDDGTEEFEFDQTDYEFATGNRRFKKQTKEDRIYGIWAEDDEQDDSNRSSFGFTKSQKDTAPLRFVSGGVTIGHKRKPPDATVGPEPEEEDEVTVVEARPEKRAKPFGQQPTCGEAGSQVFAGLRGFSNGGFQSTSGTDTAWLKSGKGNVIMQMMQKMGYEQGKGLGKSKQGIVEPVQAVQRPGRGAVGAYGSEAKGPMFGESAAEAQSRIRSGEGTSGSGIAVEPLAPSGSWRKTNAGRVKVQYKTLDEVISDGDYQSYGGGVASSSVGKIIDMTGPEQRVYEDFSSFSRRSRMPTAGDSERTNFNIPELSHNLNTLLDVTEEHMRKSDRQIRHILEGMSQLIRSFYKLQGPIAYDQHSLAISLNMSMELFTTLRTEYAAEYLMYGLDSLAIPVLLPKIKAFFANWDPLDPEQISYGLSMMSEWKDLLGKTKGGSLFKYFDKESSSSISAFDHCIWSGWMPNVRRAALGWSPRSNGPVMVSLVQMWSPILPDWVLENFIEQILVPRIKSQVDEWDPFTDMIPIETWLHPWHQIMGHQLSPIYAALRQKLAKGLKNWSPGDRSAIECIRPWKDIFSASTMHTFVSMNIVPKLERALQVIDINNTDQFEYLEIFEWLEMISPEVIGQLLVTHFFPRYYQQLCYQLNTSNMSMAEFEGIKKSYIDWKNLMPQEIQKQELVMAELKRVLIPLSQAQSRLHGTPVPSVQPGPYHPVPQMPSAGHFGLPPPPPQFTAQLPPSSFKQMVESRAAANGIQFFPQRSKFHDGKQVYMFGDFSVYIESTMLFYYSPPKRQWLPASLNQMLEMCRER